MYHYDIVVYGIQMDMESLWYQMIEKDSTLEEDEFGKKSEYMIAEHIEKLYPGLDATHKRCCYFDGSIFVGLVSRGAEICYRYSDEEYDSPVEYLNNRYGHLNKLRTDYESRWFSVEPTLLLFMKDFGVKSKKKFYAFTNDCESCT